MNQWMNARVNQWVDESWINIINDWVNGWVAIESMNQLIHGSLLEWINESTDHWTNEPTSQWIHEPKPMTQWMNEPMDEGMGGWKHGWRDGWMKAWMDGLPTFLCWAYFFSERPLRRGTSSLSYFFSEQPLIWATYALSCLPASPFVASAAKFFSVRSCHNAISSHLPKVPRSWFHHIFAIRVFSPVNSTPLSVLLHFPSAWWWVVDMMMWLTWWWGWSDKGVDMMMWLTWWWEC